MERTLVFDLPVRLFHWLFAAGFLAAATIAIALGEHHWLFPYHALIGLVLVLMAAWRVVWGLAGSRYARFRALAFRPRAVIDYLHAELSGAGQEHVGHNPASAYAIFAFLILVFGLGTTGVMMGLGYDAVEEVHETLAWTMLAVVGIHLAGVIHYTVRHKRNIALSMVHGRKAADAQSGIASARPVAAVIFLVLVAAWAGGLVRGFNPTGPTIHVPIVGTALTIGENEHHDQPDHDDD
ncbi:MAG TPA: cytochrome b/b6 domain-containing protein [Phycisphaerae bacterium]|nr:cytochrome b/b6 domain-containing protein [Phycisphaerales bacterium]HRX84899.1 cytochrome b/b6 domain-containing protein [Phycisphaerae bacterium]